MCQKLLGEKQKKKETADSVQVPMRLSCMLDDDANERLASNPTVLMVWGSSGVRRGDKRNK